MGTLKTMFKAAVDNWLLILAILVNLALAAPAAAGWDNDLCYDGTEVIPCCSSCSFFCDCGE